MVVILFRSRRLPNSLPQRNRFVAAFASLPQVSLHQLLLVGADSLINRINPILRPKMTHFFPPTSFPLPNHSPATGTIYHPSGIRASTSLSSISIHTMS